MRLKEEFSSCRSYVKEVRKHTLASCGFFVWKCEAMPESCTRVGLTEGSFLWQVVKLTVFLFVT